MESLLHLMPIEYCKAEDEGWNQCQCKRRLDIVSAVAQVTLTARNPFFLVVFAFRHTSTAPVFVLAFFEMLNLKIQAQLFGIIFLTSLKNKKFKVPNFDKFNKILAEETHKAFSAALLNTQISVLLILLGIFARLLASWLSFAVFFYVQALVALCLLGLTAYRN